MSWWNAFSTCWPPGQDGCVIWWDAWAAMGTMIGVLIALLAPLIRQWRNARRLNAIIALRFADELALAKAALTILARSYPTIDPASRLSTAKKLIESEKYRAGFIGAAEKIAPLGDAALDFGQLPLGGSLKLTLEVARAVFAAKAVSGTVIYLMKPGSDQAVEVLALALETYQREYGDAMICVSTALTQCSIATAAYNPRRTGR